METRAAGVMQKIALKYRAYACLLSSLMDTASVTSAFGNCEMDSQLGHNQLLPRVHEIIYPCAMLTTFSERLFLQNWTLEHGLV
jgi:hypothetical protein